MGIKKCFKKISFACLKRTVIVFFLILSRYNLISQTYENISYQINISNKVIGKKIIKGDTVMILGKKSGSKYVDSSKLAKLDKNIEYGFNLPDSLPNGKYSAYYNDRKQNITFIIEYKNNKRNEAFKFYHYNQSISSIGFYKNNCLDKVFIRYSNIGKVMGIYNFSNCKSNGVTILFANTGEFFSITNYKDGEKDGNLIQYKYDNKDFPKIQYDFDYKEGKRLK